MVTLETAMVAAEDPGAVTPAAEAQFTGYAGASTLEITQSEAAKLEAVMPDEVHDILPTGEVYVSQIQYRRLLNGTFGHGQWALVPRGEYIRQDKTLCREYALVVRGHFVAEAVGEADYHDNNERMSWATAAEALKSNALTRCCKDLCVASECWDRRWTEAWKSKWAIQVWRKDVKKPEWRRVDAPPFWNETGIVAGQKPQQPQAARRPEVSDEGPETAVIVDKHMGTEPPPSTPAVAPYVNKSQVDIIVGAITASGLPKEEAQALVKRVAGVDSIKKIQANKVAALVAELAKVGAPALPAEPYKATDADVEWMNPPVPPATKTQAPPSTGAIPPCPRCKKTKPVIRDKFRFGAFKCWEKSTLETGCGHAWTPGQSSPADEPGAAEAAELFTDGVRR